MKKQILKRILSSISATTLAVTSLGLNTVLAANAESAAPAAQTKEHTEAADHVHDDCCDGCCGEEAPAGQGVTIALLDAGVTNYETAGKTSFIDDDTIDSDHGNDMMSILKDTAPGADVLDVRVLDDDGKGTYANVEKGIRWAVDNSADIIVMSFVGDKKSALLENALTYAEEHEVLVVASAGNYSSEKACYPAAYPTVISVGALDENGNVQDYSNFGDYVDTFVEWSDGTSGAAQNVAAFAAITMQQSPEKSASDIRETYVADKSTSFEASKEDNADTVVYAAKCTSHRYKFKMTARAATCTTGGVEIWVCANYGCSASQTRNTKALGHNPGNWTREKNPTCTANGSDIRKCTRCNAVVNRRTVNKLGHNPGNWTREKNPTCTVDGSDIRKCTRCKAIVSRRTVNKLGHNPGNWIREKNPTCTTNGSEIRKCIRCGAVVSRRTIAAPGHYFKFKQTAKPATCTTGGVEIWACTRSGCKATQTRNTKALGHAMSAWTTTPATCTSPAIQTRKCTRSGCTYKETRKTGSALGHAMSAWTTTTPATCTSPAIQTRKCTRKNCTYKETRKTGSALGHNFKLKQVAKPATCTTGGVEIWACTRSGCKATQTRNTKALGHSYKWVVTKQPTCTATGVKQYKCSRSGCGRVANSAAVPALGHNFKLKQVVKQATCTTAGVEIWACTRSGCKATQTKNIKALGHDLTAWKIITPATTTKEGKKERSCKRSGCKYKETAVIPKIGTLTIDDCGFKSFNFVGDGSLEEGQHSWPLYYDAGGKKYLLLNFETNTDWSVSATQSYVQILDKNLKKVTSGKAGKNTVLVAFTSFPVTSYDLARTASITFKANTTTKSYSLRQSNFTINGLEKKDYINQSKIASYIKELGANSAAAKALKGEGTIGTMSVYSFGDHRRIAVSNRKTTAKTIQIEYAVFKAKVNQGPNENEVEIELMDTNGMKLLQNGSLLTTTGVINSDYKHVYDEVYAQHEKNASMFTKFVTNAASLACSYFLPISNKLISFGVGYGRGKLISGVGKLITNCVFEDNGNNTVKTTSTVSLCDGCSFTNNGDSVTIYISNTSNTKCSINLRVVDSRGNSTPVQYNY